MGKTSLFPEQRNYKFIDYTFDKLKEWIVLDRYIHDNNKPIASTSALFVCEQTNARLPSLRPEEEGGGSSPYAYL